MDLNQFISSVNALNPLDILLDAAALNTQELADTNRANLLKGELASGEQTEEYATASYTNFKSSIGSVSVPNMDFKLKGGFHAGINTKVAGKEIVTGSTDSKSPLLQAKAGDEIFTVQEKQFSLIIGNDIWSVINKKLKG